jgi:hypothetical protein
MDQNIQRVQLAIKLVTELNRARIQARLFGGAALAVGRYWDDAFQIPRSVKDIDVVFPSGALTKLPIVVSDIGGSINRATVLLNDGRLIRASFGGLLVDLYSDPLFLNQTIRLGARLGLNRMSLTVADLLATKLQINEPTERDARDIVALLAVCQFQNFDSCRGINVTRIAQLCSESWTFYCAANKSLSMVKANLYRFDLDEGQSSTLSEKLTLLQAAIEGSQRSWSWKLRELVGSRLRMHSDIDTDIL